MVGHGHEVVIKLQPQNYSEHKTMVSLNLHNVVCKLVHQLEDGIYITDKFFPEHINDNNDYFHYGFLKLVDYDFVKLKV